MISFDSISRRCTQINADTAVNKSACICVYPRFIIFHPVKKYSANPFPKGSFYSIFCEKIVFQLTGRAEK